MRASRPRTSASATVQLRANQTRRARTASPQLSSPLRRMAQTARNSPKIKKSSGITSTAPVIWRTGRRSWAAVATAVATSSRVKASKSRSPNHCTAPTR